MFGWNTEHRTPNTEKPYVSIYYNLFKAGRFFLWYLREKCHKKWMLTQAAKHNFRGEQQEHARYISVYCTEPFWAQVLCSSLLLVSSFLPNLRLSLLALCLPGLPFFFGKCPKIPRICSVQFKIDWVACGCGEIIPKKGGCGAEGPMHDNPFEVNCLKTATEVLRTVDDVPRQESLSDMEAQNTW